ncbi:MAG: 4-alpha-glucanotransferase, partial [Candidatus Thorarchaeota archaeon]
MNSFSQNENSVESIARKGGVLLHPTSFPGKFGIGDLGLNAYKFIDFLFKYKQNLWQVLPLGPTGYGNSPYQCFSAFAGNPLLISPDKLRSLNLLTEKECTPQDTYLESIVDYGKVIPYKWELLELAFNRFSEVKPNNLMKKFKKFIIKHSFWLDEFCLFMSIKKVKRLKAWFEWEDELKFRDVKTLVRWKEDHHKEIEFSKFCQFIFFLQWKELKAYANEKNIQIIGDIPIFVAYDSVDVWANSEYYYLDENKELMFVAGVPPDYFSSTGQRWGNPLYKWDLMRKNNYQWWAQRIKHNLEQVNILRIDHFRGFESYWQIPNEEETAIIGKWMTGPGLDFFRT